MVNGNLGTFSVALALYVGMVDPFCNVICCPYGHPDTGTVWSVKLMGKKIAYTTAFVTSMSPQIFFEMTEQVATGWSWKNSVIRRTPIKCHSYHKFLCFYSSFPFKPPELQTVSCLQTNKLKRLRMHMSPLKCWHLTWNYSTRTTIPPHRSAEFSSVFCHTQCYKNMITKIGPS